MTSKLIKGTGTKVGVGMDVIQEGGVVHKRVVEAKDKAVAIIRAADEEATRIKTQATMVLEQSKRDAAAAVKKGYAEGESKGMAQATKKLVELEHLREKFFKSVEGDVIMLSMEIAEKVIGKLAKENPELIKSVVRLAIERSLGDRIFVRLNPQDYGRIMSAQGDFKDILDRTKRLVFREDETIAEGGCIVESEVGTIDAQLDLQLDAIRKALEIQ